MSSWLTKGKRYGYSAGVGENVDQRVKTMVGGGGGGVGKTGRTLRLRPHYLGAAWRLRRGMG